HADVPEARHNVSTARKDQGQLDEAVTHYQRALVFKPDYAEAHNNLGNALQKQGQLDAAIAHYQQALALKPDFAEAHNNLGLALQDEAKANEAVAHFRRALTLNPADSQAHKRQWAQRAGRIGRGGGTVSAGAGTQAGLRRGPQQHRHWHSRIKAK